MKKVAFIRKDRGSSSLEDKAEQLRRIGHLEAIVDDKLTGNRLKYYSTMAMDDFNLVAEVTIMAGRIVSVRTVSKDILRTVNIPVPEFGGF